MRLLLSFDRARVTFFGAEEPGCSTASCGARVVVAQGEPGLPLSIQAGATYSRAGRYVVRLEATDGGGGLLSVDYPIVVRKLNDTTRAAPCCRYSATVVTAQQGRPIDSRVFRNPSLYGYASSLGWPSGYMDQEDLEAERLFDYGWVHTVSWQRN